MKICFVCQGNIIRSPLAENLFRRILQQRGVEEKYQLDSAGTSAYHVGEQPDRRMRQTARERGFQYDGRARQFQKEELDHFDLIIAMDQANKRILENWASAESQLKKIRMMREFDPQGQEGQDVPDPYYGGPEGFERTYEIVERSVEGLVEALESGRITS